MNLKIRRLTFNTIYENEEAIQTKNGGDIDLNESGTKKLILKVNKNYFFNGFEIYIENIN